VRILNEWAIVAACMAVVRARQQARPYNTVYHTDGTSHLVQSRGMDIADLDLWWALTQHEEMEAKLAGLRG
jgi:hypothetical protein